MTSIVPEEPPHYMIFDRIMRWGEKQEDIIDWAWQSPGGWEGWAQVELHRVFHYTATRESDAYRRPPQRKAKRADLAFNDGPFVLGETWANVPQERVLMELKCESEKDKAKFKDGVRKDIEKINGDIKEKWSRVGGCTLYSIALSMSDEGPWKLQDLDMRRYNDYSKRNPPFQLWWTMRYISQDQFYKSNLPVEKGPLYTETNRKHAGGPVSYEDSTDEDQDDSVRSDDDQDDYIRNDEDHGDSIRHNDVEDDFTDEDRDGNEENSEGESEYDV